MKIFTFLLLLFLAVELKAERNIAQGKTSTQSSTLSPYVAERAVDGNMQTSSRTSATPAPYWWKVDLQIPEKIESIKIHFEKVYSAKTNVSVSLNGNTWSSAKLKDGNSTSTSYTTPINKHYRYVRVERHDQALVINEVEIYRQPLSAEEKTHIPFKPSFVSRWYDIESQSSKSGVTIQHNLRSTPIKVIADVKVQDKNTEYIFQGIGAPQADDDGKQYGGVVVLYDEHKVLLFAPKRNNGASNLGKVIYLGSKNSWTGPEITRTYNKAKVRVRAWKTTDFPVPSFSSNWIYVETGNGATDKLYNEVQHFMNEYPDMVVVQVKINHDNHTYWFEGQGSTSVIDVKNVYNQVSGAVFGYNERSIRIWFASKKIGNFYTGCVFHVVDGWGGINFKVREGHYKIMTWKLKPTALYSIEKHQKEPTAVVPFALSLQNMMVHFQFKVNEGLHSGFRFDGVGSSMDGANAYRTYGGLLYGNNDTHILMWVPKAGYIFNFGGMWGENVFHQRTNNVNISIKVLALFEREDLVCKVDKKHFPSTDVHEVIYGTTLRSECSEGERYISGNKERICQKNGDFSKSDIVCEAIECPTEIMNATAALVNLTGNQYMDKATYKCPIHHRRGGGDTTRLCLSNSTWSGEPLICNRCRCPCWNETSGEITQLMEQTRKQLTLHKQELTTYVLKKISVKDDRIAAKGIGITSGCILVVIFVLVIFIDAPIFYRQCKQAIERLCR